MTGPRAWPCPLGIPLFLTALACAQTAPIARAEPLDPEVNLELATATPIVDVGALVEVQLIARAGINDDIPIAGIQAILGWDSAVLGLAGIIHNTSPQYEWFLSGFNDDSGLDNLNDGVNTPPIGLPFNDGDAFYEAHSQFAPELRPIVGPDGMLVTTLVFEALGAAAQTKISIPLLAGDYTISAVYLGEGAPGIDILGHTSNVFVTVTPEPSTGAIVFVLAMMFPRMGSARRRNENQVGRATRHR